MKQSIVKDLTTDEIREKIKGERSGYVKMKISHAVSPIEKIKTAVEELSGTSIAQEDMVLQKLLAKYTGLLGKITSYINTKYNVTPEETDETPEETEETPEEAPEAKPKPKVNRVPTVTSGAPDYSKTV